ncbi:unnamed protein product [Lota lota]
MTSKSLRSDKSPVKSWNSSIPDRVSLFEESYRTMRKKFLLHRLIVIAALPESLADREKLGAHYEDLNLRLQRQHHVESIRGLLLMYPSCLLHVIESSSEVLVSLLQNLKDLQEDGRLVETAKVVLISHDLPNRLFHQWSYKMLTMQARALSEETEGETTDALVGTVRSMILKLGAHLEIASETLPGSLLDETPELVVPQEVLVRLLARPELLSPQQYLQTYHSPLNISMDSEFPINRQQEKNFHTALHWYRATPSAIGELFQGPAGPHNISESWAFKLSGARS